MNPFCSSKFHKYSIFRWLNNRRAHFCTNIGMCLYKSSASKIWFIKHFLASLTNFSHLAEQSFGKSFGKSKGFWIAVKSLISATGVLLIEPQKIIQISSDLANSIASWNKKNWAHSHIRSLRIARGQIFFVSAFFELFFLQNFGFRILTKKFDHFETNVPDPISKQSPRPLIRDFTVFVWIDWFRWSV